MSFCIRDSKCRVYDPAAKVPGYVTANPLCISCQEDAAGSFNSLRYDYVDLSQLFPKIDVRNEVGKIFRPKPESSPPLNMAPFTLRGDIAFFVAVVCKAVRRACGLPPNAFGPAREGWALDVDVEFLTRRIPDLTALGPTVAFFGDTEHPETLSGPQMADRARALHLKARRMCGTEPRVIKVPGFCPYCNAMSLRRNDDNPERIWCLACRAQLSDIDYARITLLHLQQARNPAE